MPRIATSLPPDCHLCHRQIISQQALKGTTIGPDAIIRITTERAREELLGEIVRRHTQVRRSSDEIRGHLVVELDCYVFTHRELEALLASAREDGAADAFRFSSPF